MPKRTIEIRTRIKVEVGSAEEMLWEYLKDKKATPYKFHEMLTMATEAFWLALAYQYKKQPEEIVSQALADGNYRWQRHENYLQRKTRQPIKLECEQPPEAFSIVDPQLKKIVVETETESSALVGRDGSNPGKILSLSNLALSTPADTLKTNAKDDPGLSEAVENETVEEKKAANLAFNPFGEGIISRSFK